MRKLTATTIAALLALASGADAATLRGKLVNRTTGEVGEADVVRLVDVAQGMGALQELKDVRGEFTLEDVPETAAHLLLQIEKDGINYSQSVSELDPQAVLEIDVYDVGTDTTNLTVGIHHVLFQRDQDHMVVTELFEFLNESDPPVALPGDSGAIRFHVPHDFHGEIEASAGSSSMPIRLPVEESGEEDVYTVDYALRPGPTRVILSYMVPYQDHLQWDVRALYPEVDRRVMASPPDISVEAANMIPTESQMEGFAAYAGLAIEAGDGWSVHLHGGSSIAPSRTGGSGESQIVQRYLVPNPVFQSKTLILIGLSLLLVVALVAGIVTGPKPSSAAASEASAVEKKRARLSRLADRYVSGEIDRVLYEQERDQILGARAKSRHNGASSKSPAPSA